MCWSGEASAVLAVAGFATSGYVAYKKEPMPLWITLGYFSLMEALQAFTYSVINQCSLPSNQIATLLGYLHITFQTFFINALAMYFIPNNVRKKIQFWVYACCFIAAISMIIKLFPFDWSGSCSVGRPLCGAKLCSVSGNWHIAWEVPTNSLGEKILTFNSLAIHASFIPYVIAGMILPFLYGSWKMAFFHLMLGPILSRLTTNNMNEWPAVWCLLSIGILMIIVKTPLRDKLHVKKWFLWPKNWVL